MDLSDCLWSEFAAFPKSLVCVSNFVMFVVKYKHCVGLCWSLLPNLGYVFSKWTKCYSAYNWELKQTHECWTKNEGLMFPSFLVHGRFPEFVDGNI